MAGVRRTNGFDSALVEKRMKNVITHDRFVEQIYHSLLQNGNVIVSLLFPCVDIR